MTYETEVFTSSIVVVGDFNPAIISPGWLARNGLIGEDDAKAAREDQNYGKTLLVSHQVTNFETSWFTLQVLENQFSLTNKEALSTAFKDLAVGIFQLLSHTPANAVGLNFMAHFKLGDKDEYHRVGDKLAPKSIWENAFSEEFAIGTEHLTMVFQAGGRDDSRKTKDSKRISLQASNRIKYGIKLSLNDHHDVSSCSVHPTQAEKVAEIIDTEWQETWNQAKKAFDHVLSRATEQ